MVPLWLTLGGSLMLSLLVCIWLLRRGDKKKTLEALTKRYNELLAERRKWLDAEWVAARQNDFRRAEDASMKLTLVERHLYKIRREVEHRWGVSLPRPGLLDITQRERPPYV